MDPAAIVGAGWSLKLTHLFAYDGDPPEGVGTTDYLLTLGLQYSF